MTSKRVTKMAKVLRQFIKVCEAHGILSRLTEDARAALKECTK